MDGLNLAVWFAATAIFVLGPIILIHELGHFLVAKRAGIRVEEFGMGFPPRLLTLGRERGTIAVGSVRLVIPGRLRLPRGIREGQAVEALAQREEDGARRLLRLTVLEEDVPGTVVRETPEGQVVVRGVVTAFEPGTEYTLNLIPVGGFVRMTGEEDPSDPRSLAAQPKRWRLAVLLAGPLANVLAAVLLLTVAYTLGHPERYLIQVGAVEEGTPAEAAGLQPGDILLAIGGTPLEGTTPMEVVSRTQTIIRRSPGVSLTVSILREGEPLLLTAVPREGESGRGFLGILMTSWLDPSGVVRYPLPRAFVFAARDLTDNILMLVRLPSLVARGEVSPSDARPTSVVGINEILILALQQSVETGLPWHGLSTAALISLALGVTNLLPLPALDGGRVIFVLIEAVRRRRIRPEVEAAIHFAGLLVLLVLVAFIMIQDVINPPFSWSLLK